MRPIHAVPLLALVAVAVMAALATRPAPPYRLELDAPPQGVLAARPELTRGDAVLEGTVVDPDGAPVAGATLFVAQRDRPLWATTDGQGRFRMPDVDTGAVRVAVNQVEHRPVLLDTTAGAGPVTLRLPERIPAPPRLPRPVHADLEGVVRLPRAKTLEGYEVALLPVAPADQPGTGLPRRELTDAEGRFRFEALEAAEYRVLLLPPDARGGSWPDLLTGWNEPARRIVHPLGVSPLSLEAVCGTIAGRARVGGAPVGGAMVQASPVPGGEDQTAPERPFPAVQTDATGAFRIPHLPPGRYRVQLIAGRERRAVEIGVPPGAVVDPGF